MCSDLGEVEGLHLQDVRGGALELDAQYPLDLATLVLIRGHEDGPHLSEVYNRCALYDTVAPMQEVRVESLEGLEMQGKELRLSANSGALSIVFPKEVWDHLLTSVSPSGEPEATELEELENLREQLKAFAEDNSFAAILEGVRCGEDRRARAVCAVAVADGGGEVRVFQGVVRGEISPEPRGEGGFGWDPIFVPEGSELTYAQMGDAKNEDSHRARAFRQVRRWLEEMDGKEA